MVAKQFCISMIEKRIIIQIAAGNAIDTRCLLRLDHVKQQEMQKLSDSQAQATAQ